ncbi:MAG: hypothetical protein RL207_1882 [Bacteroidota bacterium]|jgi:hypothetical protein
MAQELQEQVKQALVDQSFRTDTLAQLAKDFQRCGLTLHSTDVDDLLSSIASCIKNVSNTQLQQLIYLIDIPESIFVSLSRKASFHQELSEAILMREALKVYLRHKFSEQ